MPFQAKKCNLNNFKNLCIKPTRQHEKVFVIVIQG